MSSHYKKGFKVVAIVFATGMLSLAPSGHAYASNVDLDALLQRVRAYDARYNKPTPPPVRTIQFQRFAPASPSVPAVPQLRTIPVPSATPGSNLNPLYMTPAGYISGGLQTIPPVILPTHPMGSRYNPVHFRSDSYNNSGLPTIQNITLPTAPLGSRYNPIYVR